MILSKISFLLLLSLGDSSAVTRGQITKEETVPKKVVLTSAFGEVAMYLTEPDRSALFQKQTGRLRFTEQTNYNPTITVSESDTYQTIDGFGYCLTGGSASLLNHLPATAKLKLLEELFLTKNNGIGISYLRVTIGASDLSTAPFSYDDVEAGKTDFALTGFNINQEKADLIPLLKQIIALRPDIKILGSPWSAPEWMKSNKSFIGGSLKPECYDVYAQYFVKYIQAFKANGITIDAITPQNEPLNPHNNPSMVMQAGEQANFIKNNLRPQFAKAGIKTKIIIYDHNADKPDYAIQILEDPLAAKFVDGSAFHLYGGQISALSKVHERNPDKNVYFTEEYTSGKATFEKTLNWHITNLIIGATRNWSKNVLEWNLASDPAYQPHTNGGCVDCMGALTIGDSIMRNVSYYIIAHASKFVVPGSVRIGSNLIDNLPNVAFKTPDGKKVLILINTGSTRQDFNISFNKRTVSATLNKNAVATFVW